MMETGNRGTTDTRGTGKQGKAYPFMKRTIEVPISTAYNCLAVRKEIGIGSGKYSDGWYQKAATPGRPVTLRQDYGPRRKFAYTKVPTASNLHFLSVRNQATVKMTSAVSVPSPFSRNKDTVTLGTESSLGLETSSSPSQVDVDNEVIFECDKGMNRPFPNEPILSGTFKEYLRMLNEGEPEKIKALAQNPPATISWEKFLKRPLNKSYCLITTEDLKHVQNEITRIRRSSLKKQRLPPKDAHSTIELLSLHENLVSHILTAKARCIDNYLNKLQTQGLQTGETSSPEGRLMQMQVQTKEVHHSLYWQTVVFRGIRRQTEMTPFMVEKRVKKQGLSSLLRRQKRKSTKTSEVGISASRSQKEAAQKKAQTQFQCMEVIDVE